MGPTLVIQVNASIASTDTLYISSITSPATSDGITFSSDVVMHNSSMTFQGAGGFIISKSSITASSFRGYAGSLTSVGASLLSATQTFSGANTFTSNFTVLSGGRDISFSTGTQPNLAIGSSGDITFFPELHNSSHTIIPEYTTSATTFGPCVLGSTLTITTAGGRVEVSFTGSGSYVSGTGGLELNFLQDGAFVADMTNQYGIISDGMNPGVFMAESFNYLVPAPPPGTHSYCLTVRATIVGFSGSMKLNNDQLRGNIFYVKEIR